MVTAALVRRHKRSPPHRSHRFIGGEMWNDGKCSPLASTAPGPLASLLVAWILLNSCEQQHHLSRDLEKALPFCLAFPFPLTETDNLTPTQEHRSSRFTWCWLQLPSRIMRFKRYAHVPFQFYFKANSWGELHPLLASYTTLHTRCTSSLGFESNKMHDREYPFPTSSLLDPFLSSPALWAVAFPALGLLSHFHRLPSFIYDSLRNWFTHLFQKAAYPVGNCLYF